LNCEFCNNNKLKKIGSVVFLKKECAALMCEVCGNVMKDYIPTSSEFNNFYQGIGHDNDILYDNKLTEQLKFLHESENLKTINSVLEIGPGSKGLLSKLDSSIEKYSCEIDGNAVSNLEKNNVVNFVNLDIINEKFDLIILSHVMEHVIDDLGDYILKLKSLLTKDGIVFIEVPTAEFELMIDDNKLINHYFSDGHKRSSTEKSFQLLFHRLNIKKFRIKTTTNRIRKLEYKHRFKYSQLLEPICINKNSRGYFVKVVLLIMYHVFISAACSFIVKKRNIPQASIKIIINNG
jgi:SAM-dependent methyltransferase